MKPLPANGRQFRLTAVFVGLAIGMAAALGISKFVESLLYGIKSNDPLALLGAVAILLAAVTLGGYAPAWKASRIDPMAALRHE